MWALALAAACQAQSASNPTPAGGGDEISDSELAAGLLGLVIVPVLVYKVRRRLDEHIRLRMRENRAAKEDGDTEEPGAREIDAHVQLQLAFHDSDEATGGGFEARMRGERRLFGRMCLADLGVSLGYVGLPWLSGGWESEAASYGIGAGLLMAFFTVMRYVLFRGQFRAFNLSRSRRRQRVYRWLGRIAYGIVLVATMGRGGGVAYLPDVLRAIFGLRTVFSVVLMAVMAVTAVSTIWEGEDGGFGLLAAACLHAGVFTLVLRGMRQVGGPRLLILRVFDIEAASSFIFSGLMRYWRHFGNHLTVVDVSMVRQDRSNKESRTIFMVLGMYVALMGASMFLADQWKTRGHSLGWFVACAGVLTLTLVPAWAALMIGKRRIDSRFVSRPEQLLARLRRMEQYPRRRDLSFRHVRAMCHDHTWFLAVREFARRADVVLMDLRGYCHQRKGCQKEVDFLFDAVPVDRLLFLVDVGNDESVVSEMLMARWEQLSQTSPNLGLSAPVVHLYRVLDNDERDMQAILNRLIDTADAAVAEPNVSEPSRA